MSVRLRDIWQADLTCRSCNDVFIKFNDCVICCGSLAYSSAYLEVAALKTRLRYIPLSEAREDMVLGAPLIIAEHGVTNFSLPAGHELTEQNIRQIALRHGEFLCIQEADSRSEAEYAEAVERSRARLDVIFSLVDRSRPAAAGLYKAVLAYRSM